MNIIIKEHKEKTTINYLKQMTNKDLRSLSNKAKQNLIELWKEWVLIEENINAVSFISNNDYINKRLEEIYFNGVLE